jgi:hypothetical protein
LFILFHLFIYFFSVLVFRPSQPEALLKRERVLKNQVIAAILLPQSLTDYIQSSSGKALEWQKQSRLYLLDRHQLLFTPEYLDDFSSEYNTMRTKVV